MCRRGVGLADLGARDEAIATAAVVTVWSCALGAVNRGTRRVLLLGGPLFGAGTGAAVYALDGSAALLGTIVLLTSGIEVLSERTGTGGALSRWWDRLPGPSKDPADYR